ncbi:MAG TPA: LysR family transcriptional regulator [Burkholderiales bacterium]
MELYQLRTFAAVADTGHITRAAEKLHLSQPAVSAHIKGLEEELGVRLFERNPGGMLLTRAGRDLRGQAEKVLAEVERLRQLAATLKGDIVGRLRVGTASDPEFVRVGEFLHRTVERYPLLELELHQEVSGAALQQVRTGDLDASFYFGDITSPDVAGLRLHDMAYCVVAPAAWGDRVRNADWSDIARLPWIVTPSISTHNRLVRALFSRHGVEPARVVEADQEPVIASLVVSGVGVSLMREPLALQKQRSGEICIWDKARLQTALWFIYQADRSHDPLIEALLGILGEIWQIAPAPSF